MKKYVLSVVCGLTVGFINGLFGAGGGVAAIIFFERVLKFETHKAHAAAVATILAITVITCIVYVKNEIYDIKSTAFAACGGVAGGIIGAKLLGKMSDRYIHLVFGIFMAAAGIRMIMR